MRKLSNDIKKLNEEAEDISGIDPSVHMIQHGVCTPWGTPFVSDAGLDASVSFEFQDLSQSDLSHVMLDLRDYNSLADSQMFIVLDSVYEDFEE